MTFNAERHQLYDWMREQALQMPDYVDIHVEVMDRVDTVSNAFGQSTWAIQRNITNKNTAGFFISRSWLYDDHQRTRMIQEIMPQAAVDELAPTYVRNVVDLALWSEKPGKSAVATLQSKYHQTIQGDVTDFFTCLLVYKQAMHKFGREVFIPEGSGKPKQYEVRHQYLEWAANHYGKTALKGLL